MIKNKTSCWIEKLYMNKRLASLINKISLDEQKEVEIFVNYLLLKRNIEKHHISLDDITTGELTELIDNSNSFVWLSNTSEDIYTYNDGEQVQW